MFLKTEEHFVAYSSQKFSHTDATMCHEFQLLDTDNNKQTLLLTLWQASDNH
jgi:hypothetical protein